MKRFLVVLTMFVLILAMAVPALAGTTELLSVNSDGVQGDAQSNSPSVSRDGRFVVFWSYAKNLVSQDTGIYQNVYLRDTQTGTTEIVSVNSSGEPNINGNASSGYVSDDGRYVAFGSWGTVLDSTVGGYTIYMQAYMRDMDTGTTELISKSMYGGYASHQCYVSGISSDGRYVLFLSNATNLVPDDTGWTRDLFVYDRELGITNRVNIQTDIAGVNINFSSMNHTSDMSRVYFLSNTDGIVPGDYDGDWDAFELDVVTGQIGIMDFGMKTYSFSMSRDGRYAAFKSADDNGIYMIDRVSGVLSQVDLNMDGLPSNGWVIYTKVSDDGRFVMFTSAADDLVSSDTNNTYDVFVRDMVKGVTERVSVGSNGDQGDAYSVYGTMNGDGRYIFYQSAASNLVPRDTNGALDVFIHDRGPQTPQNPTEAIEYVEDLLDSGVIDPATANALVPKLIAAESAANGNAADGSLGAFINQINAKVRKGDIDADTGAILIEAAQIMMDNN